MPASNLNDTITYRTINHLTYKQTVTLEIHIVVKPLSAGRIALHTSAFDRSSSLHMQPQKHKMPFIYKQEQQRPCTTNIKTNDNPRTHTNAYTDHRNKANGSPLHICKKKRSKTIPTATIVEL